MNEQQSAAKTGAKLEPNEEGKISDIVWNLKTLLCFVWQITRIARHGSVTRSGGVLRRQAVACCGTFDQLQVLRKQSETAALSSGSRHKDSIYRTRWDLVQCLEGKPVATDEGRLLFAGRLYQGKYTGMHDGCNTAQRVYLAAFFKWKTGKLFCVIWLNVGNCVKLFSRFCINYFFSSVWEGHGLNVGNKLFSFYSWAWLVSEQSSFCICGPL